MTFKASAYHRADYNYGTKEYTYFPNEPRGFKAIVDCVDRAAAEEIAAKFPKYVKAKVRGRYGVPGMTACVTVDVYFGADGVNKGKNETGIKRVRKFLEVAGSVEWDARSINSYKTIEEFEAAL